MNRLSIALVVVLVAAVAPATTVVWAQVPASPAIASLSPTTAPRSGRLLIQGSGFGAVQGTGHVEIAGLPAPVTRWSDTLIAAYVPEAAPAGPAMVQVFAAGGASNAVPLTVTLRQPSGRVKWRFQADAPYILQRPALGPNGMIVVHDSGGFVYALQPDGGLRWIFKTPAFAYGPPSVDADGTVYVASINTVYALNPDGSLKWQFDDPASQGAMAGPTVGPDGNLYVVNDVNGLGAFALSPGGQLLWSNAGNPVMWEYGQVGAEVVFGPSTSVGLVDQLYVAFDRQGDAHRWAFSLTGQQRWAVPTGPQMDPFAQMQTQLAVGPDGTVYMTSLEAQGWSLSAVEPRTGAARWVWYRFPGNGMSAPDVGIDGVIYLARNLSSLEAFDPNGALRWEYVDSAIIDHPIVSPANDLIFAGGRPNFGMPGFVRAYRTADGQPLWSVDLGVVNGGNQILYSRPRFTPAGDTAYFGTAILGGNPSDPYSYLYAADTSGTSSVVLTSLALAPASVSGGATSQGTVALSSAAPPGGALVALGSSDSTIAAVPASASVGGGQTSASFTVTTGAVSAATAVTISASYGGTTQTAVLTVTPSSPDTVAIRQAQYGYLKQQLTLKATSTSAIATLTVYATTTGEFIGTLTNSGGGRYAGEFPWPVNPRSVTVRSSLGGSATKTVTAKLH